ncbi:MAG: hypothetical protein PVH61_42685 [Candidatus Aminicenantes bacterium]
MKYVKVLYLSLLLFCIMVTSVSNLEAQPQQNAQQQEAAMESLKLLKKLPIPVLMELGYKTRKMVNESKLETPLKTYIIWPGSLKTFQSGDDPGEMLQDVEELNYPVYTCEIPITSVTIRKRNGKWTFAAIGGREILYADLARNILSDSGSMPRSDYFIVQIQPMGLTFLGYYSGGTLYLVLTHHHPDLEGYELYNPLLAEEVFIELKHFVEKYETLPALSSTSPLFTVGKEELHPGESTWLKITLRGLNRYKKLGFELPFRLQNKTPGIVSMEGGNIQQHIIRPEDIDPEGIYTITRTLIGNVPGKFNISIDFE